jgi:two-component system sensor histidine kinase KdpD
MVTLVATPPRAQVSPTRRSIGFALALLGNLVLVLVLRATTHYHGATTHHHGIATQTMLMMALVVAVALIGGLLPALAAALLAGLGLNLFFVPPYGTLVVGDPENIAAIVIFLITGVAVATLVDRAARTTHQAQVARREADALADLSRKLLEAGGSEAQLLAQARATLGMAAVAVVHTASDGKTVIEQSDGVPLGELRTSDHRVGVAPDVDLVLRGRSVTPADKPLLTAYAAHLAVLRERERAAADAQHTAELAEGNRTRTALLAAVSHDLRSPLATVKAAVTSLRSAEIEWSAKDETELLAAVEDGADRLEALVANLLDLSRLQMGVVNPLITEVDVTAAICGTLVPLHNADRIVVRTDSVLPPVIADPGLLDRILANLLENALHYAPNDTAVAVEAAPACGGVAVRIVDHGPGVPTAQHEKLFTPFQRLGDVPAGTGLGLGLAAARGLAQTMNATLAATDTPGGGLTMTLTMPAADAPPKVD